MTKIEKRWRDYRTASGARPVKDFIEQLNDEEAAAVIAGMKEVAVRGLASARRVRGEIYEVRADAGPRTFRLLFAQETKFILLGLSGVFENDAEDAGARAGTG